MHDFNPKLEQRLAETTAKRSIHNNLAYDFYRQTKNQGQHTALYVNDVAWNYTGLAEQIVRLAGWLKSRYPEGGANIGILANRKVDSYIGLLAALWSGNAYVPLNDMSPCSYLSEIIEQADIDTIIVSPDSTSVITELCNHSLNKLTLCSPTTLTAATSDCLEMQAISFPPPLTEPVAITPCQSAYLVFTSGSTGKPKGIAPTVANVSAFLDATQNRYQLNKDDKFSQANDLHWDPSVFDLFSAWKVGAATYVVPAQQLFSPAHFIRKHELSVWYSGPVQIHLSQRMRLLKHNVLPSLRLSLFVGEPLLKSAASSWQDAAPNSIVENVYGPTETTVVCTGQPFTDDPDCITPERNYVAIGTPYHNAKVDIIDEDLASLPDNSVGEIAISGPIVTPGYWKSPELTAGSFVQRPDSADCWYLTGDLGYRTPEGVFHFLGRKDNQLQVHGMRIEPEEIEHHLRCITDAEIAIVLGWPVNEGLVNGLVAFVSKTSLTESEIKSRLKEHVQAQMIPQRINFLDTFPRNRNNKIDRKALLNTLTNECAPNEST